MSDLKIAKTHFCLIHNLEGNFTTEDELLDIQARFEEEIERQYGGSWAIVQPSIGEIEGVYFLTREDQWQILGGSHSKPDGMSEAISTALLIALGVEAPNN